MKKKMFAVLLAAVMICSTGACAGNKVSETEKAPEAEYDAGKDVTDGSEEASVNDTEDVLSFADLNNLQFCFSSGAGGWATMMSVDADGNFRGEYFDGDLGVTGDGYPNGTMYQCDFSGQFTEPVKVNEYTYSMQIRDINYEKEPETQEIKDEMLYCYTEPYGLEGAEDILIYLPGAPLSELPEEYKSWVGYSEYVVSETEETELPFYGLYNEAAQAGFESYDIVDSLETQLEWAEESAASLEEELQTASLTQTEMNEKAAEIYNLWDSQLNLVWADLKQTRTAQVMEELTGQEREWIQQKEQAVQEAAAEYEGSSMQSMVRDMKAAELTREQVYELMKKFEL